MITWKEGNYNRSHYIIKVIVLGCQLIDFCGHMDDAIRS